MVGSCAAAAPMPLHHGLWTCSMAFSKAGYAAAHTSRAPASTAAFTCTCRRRRVKPQDFQRIWLFTNDDMPGDESMRDQAVQKAKVCVRVYVYERERGKSEREAIARSGKAMTHPPCTSHWQDCVELNQMLMLWHMNPPGAAFDVRKFYARLIPVDEEDEAGRFIEGGAGNFDELLDRVRRKEYKKRRVRRHRPLCGRALAPAPAHLPVRR